MLSPERQLGFVEAQRCFARLHSFWVFFSKPDRAGGKDNKKKNGAADAGLQDFWDFGFFSRSLTAPGEEKKNAAGAGLQDFWDFGFFSRSLTAPALGFVIFWNIGFFLEA